MPSGDTAPFGSNRESISQTQPPGVVLASARSSGGRESGLNEDESRFEDSILRVFRPYSSEAPKPMG